TSPSGWSIRAGRRMPSRTSTRRARSSKGCGPRPRSSDCSASPRRWAPSPDLRAERTRRGSLDSMNRSVLVAMSGGVDSSVAACLLQERGYEVLGSHMRLVHLDGVEHGCCGPSARRDAAEVARIGGFPFEIADLSDDFDRTVIADFVREHS